MENKIMQANKNKNKLILSLHESKQIKFILFKKFMNHVSSNENIVLSQVNEKSKTKYFCNCKCLCRAIRLCTGYLRICILCVNLICLITSPSYKATFGGSYHWYQTDETEGLDSEGSSSRGTVVLGGE
jgi:hypothetical protein